MKIAHLSDLHLGYGLADRRGGRARDVVRAFEMAMGRITELDPSIVVIAGDVFDHPNVPAPPIAAFTSILNQFQSRLPDTPVVLVAGARDTPLDRERLGPIAVIGSLPGVFAATRRSRSLQFFDGKLNVVLVPHAAVIGARRLDAVPNPSAQWNVLVAYASLASEAGNGPKVDTTGWSYVALGSDHARRKVGPSVHYSGSLERVGPDPWAEAATDKGFLTADLESGEVTFWPAEARAVVNLAPIEATGGGPATVARRLTEALAGVPGGIEGKLLKIPVRGLSADDLSALDREVIDSVRNRAAEVMVEALPGQGRSHGRGGMKAREGRQGRDEELVALLAKARRMVDRGRGEGKEAYHETGTTTG